MHCNFAGSYNVIRDGEVVNTTGVVGHGTQPVTLDIVRVPRAHLRVELGFRIRRSDVVSRTVHAVHRLQAIRLR